MLKHDGRKSSAFSLVELIVVIVILAVLSGVAIPVYTNHARKAKSSALAATFRIVVNATMKYRIDHQQTLPMGTYFGTQPLFLSPYMDVSLFTQRPPVGDFWVWDHQTGWPTPYFGIHGSSLTADDQALFADLDRLIDDNNTGTGRLRAIPDWVWYDFDAN